MNALNSSICRVVSVSTYKSTRCVGFNTKAGIQSFFFSFFGLLFVSLMSLWILELDCEQFNWFVVRMRRAGRERESERVGWQSN